jgi:hypothetical protein
LPAVRLSTSGEVPETWIAGRINTTWMNNPEPAWFERRYRDYELGVAVLDAVAQLWSVASAEAGRERHRRLHVDVDDRFGVDRDGITTTANHHGDEAARVDAPLCGPESVSRRSTDKRLANRT